MFDARRRRGRTLFAFRHDDAKEGSAKTNCAAARFWRTSPRSRSRGGRRRLGGDSALPRDAAALSEAAAAVEASGRKTRSSSSSSTLGHTQKAETGDGRSVGHRDAGNAETSGASATPPPPTLGGAGGANRGAAVVDAEIGDDENEDSERVRRRASPAPGEDGHDKMRDRAVDANLGPERDLDDVEAARAEPLAFALAASLESDSRRC